MQLVQKREKRQQQQQQQRRSLHTSSSPLALPLGGELQVLEPHPGPWRQHGLQAGQGQEQERSHKAHTCGIGHTAD